MLYVTTRSSCETYTAGKTLSVDTAPDGGMFVPFHFPHITVSNLQGASQEAIIAAVLAIFFRNPVSEEAVLECLGGRPIRKKNMDRKVTVAQLWSNRMPTFEKVEYALYCKLCQDVTPNSETTQWAKMAIRIAVITALVASEGREVDIAVNAGDFLTPMAAYYCREMGLPIGKILCVTNENSGLWELFVHGQLNCGAAVQNTALPALDISVPYQLERLIFSLSGLHGAKEFATCATLGKNYKFTDMWGLSDCFAVPVVSAQRVASVISKTYHTNSYLLDSYTALTFGGLQDYRASTGVISQTLLLSEYSPLAHRAQVAAALSIPEFKLSELM